jgi:hypothetical protein
MESKHSEEPTSSGKESGKVEIHEVLPKFGLVYSERDSFQEILSKPKIMPLKSAVLEKLEKIEEANTAS